MFAAQQTSLTKLSAFNKTKFTSGIYFIVDNLALGGQKESK